IAVNFSFAAAFKLMQQPEVYNNTLGKVSTNYERTGNTKRYHIDKVGKPFIELTESNAYNWDATYYKKIRDSLYAGTNMQYADRYAFYPLFPIVWKISGIRSVAIIVFNYLLFALS